MTKQGIDYVENTVAATYELRYVLEGIPVENDGDKAEVSLIWTFAPNTSDNDADNTRRMYRTRDVACINEKDPWTHHIACIKANIRGQIRVV